MTSHSGDSYRLRQRSRSPPHGPRGFTGGSTSRFRGREFEFEHPRHLPSRVRESDRDRYPEREPDRGRYSEREHERDYDDRDSYRPSTRGGRGGGGGRGSRTGRPFKKRVPLPAHDRPILNFDYRAKTPELMPGMITGGFDGKEEEEEKEEEKNDDAAHEEMDEGEGGDAPMELSDEGEEDVEAVKPALESAVTKVDSVSAVSLLSPPSPPPPLPSLPPLSPQANVDEKLIIVEGKEFVEADKKRVDVITMIRQAKAKIAAEKAIKKDSVAANDDFISLNFEPEKPSNEQDNRKMRKLNDSSRTTMDPSGDASRPFSHKEHLHGAYIPKDPIDEGPPGVGPLSRAGKLAPPPGPGTNLRNALNKRGFGSDEQDDYDYDDDYKPDPRDIEPDLVRRGTHGHLDVPQSRKRKYDEITRKGNYLDGNIKRELQPKPEVNHIPWITAAKDHSRTLKMSMWLHMEIVDFIEYIKPRPYEHAVRRYVIQRLRRTVQKLWKDTDVRAFGSFAAELYLPTSDVDLVVVSKDYVLGDYSKYSSKSYLFRVATAIRTAGLAERNNVQVVAGAKVPIVKYTDEATGLHVDISFENKSGLVANDTFKEWREKYPCLPILLTLLKHFLAMRGLNEPYQGGVGSFTLCCLLISLFQQLPSVASGEINPSNNLGLILLEFLELYGKHFNTRRVAIRVDSNEPSYFGKEELFQLPKNPKPSDETLLVIQDPNNTDNNISRSSYLIKMVLACFSEAYDALVKQMGQLELMGFEQRKGRSLLGLIIGGDYRQMEAQRELLREVYIDRVGREQDLIELNPGEELPPPPPLPPGPPPLPPPPPPSYRDDRGRPDRNGSEIGRGQSSDRSRGMNRGRAAGRNGKRYVADIDDEEEDAFERLRGKTSRRGGARGGFNGTGDRSNPISLD